MPNTIALIQLIIGSASPLKPSWRNEFHVGFQQAFGKYLVVDAEYLWK
jgi:hypothetical protein